EHLLDDGPPRDALHHLLERVEGRGVYARLPRERDDPRDERDGFDAELGERDRLVEREAARERPADDDLGATFEADGGEQIAVTAQAEHGALVGARGGGDARGLVDAARDEGREQARASACLIGEADANRKAADERRSPLEAA